MDKERSREIKRAAVATGRLPPTRRQQKSPSFAHLDSKEHHIPEQVMVVDKWRREKGARESEERGGEDRDTGGNDDGRPPVAASAACSRKRVKLMRKISVNYRAVDSAVVPRKLRSAINKRCGDSPSPGMLHGKRKCGEVPGANANGSMSKEEEEVAEILTALAAMVMSSRPFESTTDREMPGDVADSERTCLEVLPKEGVDAGILLGGEASTLKSAEADSWKQNAPGVVPVSGKGEPDGNGGGCPDPGDASKLPCLANAPSDTSSPNGVSEPANTSGSSLPNLVQIVAASSNCDVKAGSDQEQKDPCSMIREDVSLGTQNASATASNDKRSTRPFSTEVVALGSIAAARSFPTSDGKRIRKPPLLSIDGRRWKKCATHIYISHLIQSYQSAKEKKVVLSQNHTKPKEPTNSTKDDPTKNGPSSSLAMATPATATSPQNRMLAEAQQPQNTPAVLFMSKQTHDFLSLSTGGGTSGGPANKTELPPKLPVAYLHSLPPQQPALLLSPYPECTTAATHKQVHLQLLPPQYMSSPFYASHQMKHHLQQQHMWQAHIGQYRAPPLPHPARRPAIRQHDAPLSSVPSAVQMHHTAAGHRPLAPLQHQAVPIQLHASHQSK